MYANYLYTPHCMQYCTCWLNPVHIDMGDTSHLIGRCSSCEHAGECLCSHAFAACACARRPQIKRYVSISPCVVGLAKRVCCGALVSLHRGCSSLSPARAAGGLQSQTIFRWSAERVVAVTCEWSPSCSYLEPAQCETKIERSTISDEQSAMSS